MQTEIESILGITFDRKREIPGISKGDKWNYIYILDDGYNDSSRLFDKLCNAKSQTATAGSIGTEAFRIHLPTKEIFHGLSYKGDLEGWRNDIIAAANVLNLLTAEIKDNKIIISNGREYKLSECKTEDDYNTPKDRKTMKKETQERKVQAVLKKIEIFQEIVDDLLSNDIEIRLAREALEKYESEIQVNPSRITKFYDVITKILKKHKIKESSDMSECIEYIEEMIMTS